MSLDVNSCSHVHKFHVYRDLIKFYAGPLSFSIYIPKNKRRCSYFQNKRIYECVEVLQQKPSLFQSCGTFSLVSPESSMECEHCTTCFLGRNNSHFDKKQYPRI